MKTLLDYIREKSVTTNREVQRWDGHIHLFDHRSTIDNPISCNKCVTFMDIRMDIKNHGVAKAYDKFIEEKYNENKHILLATGKNLEEIIAVYDKHKDVIKGFGELKCYDEYEGRELPYKKISFVNQVCRFSKQCGCLPVFVHFELNNEKDVSRLEHTLQTYPMIPIVLCHCGMNHTNQIFAYNAVREMMRKYQNLWVDISFIGLTFLSSNIMLLDNLDRNKIILGSDINSYLYTKYPDCSDEKIDIIKTKFLTVERYIGGPELNIKNISKLFEMK